MTDENDNATNGQNMVSNLPLLFAGGYPTSLDKITETQLEKFVPFMVQCSCGNLLVGAVDDGTEVPPSWWPSDLKYVKPFRRPHDFKGDWHAKLKELVVMCYSHHNSIFLLRFCKQLAAYEQASLRFINNYNSTTSLFHRTSNKLLVTFRNENMMYDQPTIQRKSLLPKSPSAHNLEVQQQMVETSFDIYLCDNCDAELYSLSAYTEHEKTCLATSDRGGDANADGNGDDDDDVILIDTDESVPAANYQEEFLANFGLRHSSLPPISVSGRRRIAVYNDVFSPEKQLRCLPSRTRAAAALTKNPTIPISSPCGQILLKQAKMTMMTKDYQTERLDRLERFCGAPPLHDGNDVPRFMRNRPLPAAVNVTFRKPDDEYHCHTYKFPRRQLSTKLRKANFNLLNSLLLRAMKPFSVKVKRLSSTDIEIHKAKLRQAAQKISFDVPQKRQHVVEFIDLCSSDEDDDEAVNDDDNEHHHMKLSRNVMVDTEDYQTIIPDALPEEEEGTNFSGNSANSSSEHDENQLRKVDGTLVTMPMTATAAANPIFPVAANFSNSAIQPLRTSVTQQHCGNSSVQPLRPVFLFSNKFHHNGDSFQAADSTTPAEKATSIKDWLYRTTMQPTARKSTATPMRKIPALVNIQQYTTTTIRTTTITAPNVAT